MATVSDNSAASQHRFHVQLGLAEYNVECGDEHEARRLARRQLCEEMPHMRTVIDSILDKHIRVDSAG